MRLTDFTDYGLRTLMRLAGEPERLFTTDELAAELKVSRHHLTKIVSALAREGFIITQRGAGGGFRLAPAAEETTLGTVVRALEGSSTLVECFAVNGGGCSLTPRCRLKSRLKAAEEAFLRELDKTTLSQCALPPRRSTAAA